MAENATTGGASSGGGLGLPVTKDTLGMATRLAAATGQIAQGHLLVHQALTTGACADIQVADLCGLLAIARGMVRAWVETNRPGAKPGDTSARPPVDGESRPK